MSVHIQSEPLLICRIGGNLYAYRDRCPGCNMPLHLGHLRESTLTCGMGHQFDARHAGAGMGEAGFHLDPVPLLEVDNHIKVALALTRKADRISETAQT
jgi:nitrite reductase/ring-hydroxylating ferredoxin subunit